MNHPLTPLQPCLRQILEQPSFEGSAIRIELVHRSKHIQEYLPDRLFCFAIIVQGCAGDSEDQSTVPFKRQRQGHRCSPCARRACVWAAAHEASGDRMAATGGDVAGDDRNDSGVIRDCTHKGLG